MNDIFRFLQTRRSALALTMVEPAPDAEQIRLMVKLASRVPDHGKLAPWRFVEYSVASRNRLGLALREISDGLDDAPGIKSRDKQISSFENAPLVIGVISCPVESPKVPKWEQVLSTGAACMQLLTAANALGFEAQWLSGFYMFNKNAAELLGLNCSERLAGMIHIGSSSVAKMERTRPDIDDIFSIYPE